MEEELYGIARASIGAQFGLSEAQSARLRGTSASELRADAKQMRVELGLDPVDERERDEGAGSSRARSTRRSGRRRGDERPLADGRFDRPQRQMLVGTVAPSSRRRTANNEPIGRDELVGYVDELLGASTTGAPTVATLAFGAEQA
jgi:hypothetical protein